MCLTGNGATEVIARELQPNHLLRQASFPSNQLGGLIRVINDPLTGPLIGVDYRFHRLWLALQNPFAGIQERRQAKVRVTVEEPGAGCLRSRHMRVQAGPYVNPALLQSGSSLRVLQMHDTYIP